jgi:hypothetical protein
LRVIAYPAAKHPNTHNILNYKHFGKYVHCFVIVVVVEIVKAFKTSNEPNTTNERNMTNEKIKDIQTGDHMGGTYEKLNGMPFVR